MDGLARRFAEVNASLVGQARVLSPIAWVVAHDQGKVISLPHVLAQNIFNLTRKRLADRHRTGWVRDGFPMPCEQYGAQPLPTALNQKLLCEYLISRVAQAIEGRVPGDHHP